MNRQPNRLPAKGEHRLKGAAIDRTKPLRFWLDGRSIHGFAGDTVLSAALASGLTGAGTRAGQPLALDERYAPAVVLVSAENRGGTPAEALPMARTPALDGMKLRSLGRRSAFGRLGGGLARLLPAHRHRLQLRHDVDTPLAPWLNTRPSETLAADVAVVGGGVAGMAAALAAAELGASVILLEARPWVGGVARLFGAIGEEEAPEATIQRLSQAIASNAGIRTLLATEAFGVFPGLVQAHGVVVEGNVPTGRVVAIEAPRIVLANGALERLPVFSGNRRPGVVGVLAAYERAERFGVWIGGRALFATATSIAYRVAAHIKSEAVTVLKIADSRINPQSRFVEFGKAYGIPQVQGTIPLAAHADGRSPQRLKVTLARAAGASAAVPESLDVDQLVLSGGWQADLTLWHMAGGASRWDETDHHFAAEGSLPGIVLAGAVAGYETAVACLASGAAAIAALSGKRAPPIDEERIAAIYETPDGRTPIAQQTGDEPAPAYLDGGGSLTLRPERLTGKPGRRPARLTDQVRSLSLSDVAAAVELGLIPAEEAALVAQERCVTPGNLTDSGQCAPAIIGSSPPAGAPAYLGGRFGEESLVRGIEAVDGRRFEVGCLIYPNADRADPLAAIGVVFAVAPSGTGGLAMIGKASETLDSVSVRDISGPVSARLKVVEHEVSESPAPADGKSESLADPAGSQATLPG